MNFKKFALVLAACSMFGGSAAMALGLDVNTPIGGAGVNVGAGGIGVGANALGIGANVGLGSGLGTYMDNGLYVAPGYTSNIISQPAVLDAGSCAAAPVCAPRHHWFNFSLGLGRLFHHRRCAAVQTVNTMPAIVEPSACQTVEQPAVVEQPQPVTQMLHDTITTTTTTRYITRRAERRVIVARKKKCAPKRHVCRRIRRSCDFGS